MWKVRTLVENSMYCLLFKWKTQKLFDTSQYPCMLFNYILLSDKTTLNFRWEELFERKDKFHNQKIPFSVNASECPENGMVATITIDGIWTILSMFKWFLLLFVIELASLKWMRMVYSTPNHGWIDFVFACFFLVLCWSHVALWTNEQKYTPSRFLATEVFFVFLWLFPPKQYAHNSLTRSVKNYIFPLALRRS